MLSTITPSYKPGLALTDTCFTVQESGPDGAAKHSTWGDGPFVWVSVCASTGLLNPDLELEKMNVICLLLNSGLHVKISFITPFIETFSDQIILQRGAHLASVYNIKARRNDRFFAIITFRTFTEVKPCAGPKELC